jgi:hypothetical protein
MPRAKIGVRKEEDLKLSRREKALAVFGRLMGVKIEKTTPKNVEYVFEPEPQIRRPMFDYVNLLEVATTSWPLRRAFRAIIQESIRRRWGIEPAFLWKCDECGKTYDYTPGRDTLKEDETPTCAAKINGNLCGKPLRGPDEVQARKFEQLLKRPNNDYPFIDFVKSTIFYDLALDDFYWGVGFRRSPKTKVVEEEGKKVTKVVVDTETKKVVYEKIPAFIFVEDARFMFPVADDEGHLGGYDYFCPECYDTFNSPGDQPVVSIRPELSIDEQEGLKACPLCGGQMEQTAYVQEIGGEVTARFTRDEIVHGSSSRLAPALFGNSKIVTVWKVVQTVLAMDDYNWEVYSTGKVGSILGFPGEDQLEVDEKKKAIEAELKTLDTKDIQTGRFKSSKKIRTLMLGLKKDQKPQRIAIMESLKDMQSIEFYRLYMEAVAGLYGVTPEFVSSSDVSNGGSRLKIEVQNRTTEEQQTCFSDPFNEVLLPMFGITDWVFVFNPIEGRDVLRDAQAEHTKAAAAYTWTQAGFEVSLGPGGELIKTGIGRPQQPGPSPALGKPEQWEDGAGSRVGAERFELMAKREEDAPILARAPFGVAAEEETLFRTLKRKVLDWALREVKRGRVTEVVVGEALNRARKIIDDSYGELIERGKTHASNRTRQKVGLSPEDLKRLTLYKEESLRDVEKILRDRIKAVKVKEE